MSKKEGLFTLASLLSSFENDYFPSIYSLILRVKEIKVKKVEGIDPVLELKIGLNKILTILSLKIDSSSEFSDMEIGEAVHAAQSIFEDQYAFKSLIDITVNQIFAGYELKRLAKKFNHRLLTLVVIEALCDDDKVLSEKERIVIQNFEGVNGKNPISLSEIAPLVGLTPEKTRQVKELSHIKIWRTAKALRIVQSK